MLPTQKKILSNPYNRKGKQHLPHSFTLFSSARVQTFSSLCKMFMNTHDPTMNFHISYDTDGDARGIRAGGQSERARGMKGF